MKSSLRGKNWLPRGDRRDRPRDRCADGFSHVVAARTCLEVRDDYVHRVGRTGRAESTGSALTLVSPEEVRALRALEKAVGVTTWITHSHRPPIMSPGPSCRATTARHTRGPRVESRSRPVPRRRRTCGVGGVRALLLVPADQPQPTAARSPGTPSLGQALRRHGWLRRRCLVPGAPGRQAAPRPQEWSPSTTPATNR